MSFRALKNKLWFNIFIRIAAIFAAFVLILTVANITLLTEFFSLKEKNSLIEQTQHLSKLDINNKSEIVKRLTHINREYNFDVEIYDSTGKILYTTHGRQMMDFFLQNNQQLAMNHEEMRPIKSEKIDDSITFKRAIRRFDNSEYLLCTKEIEENVFVEVRIEQKLIANSAAIANEFITIISFAFLCLALIWVFIFARKFSKPIGEMNRITKEMTQLNFSEKLNIATTDEIGQLAYSVNELSDSLSNSLENLQAANKKLQEDIELERQLDAMRRGFVANVSHELKTPISIISGYAEGLKLNVNSDSKEAYCNTIIEESQRMNKLVLSILQLSRYESGQIPLNLTEFSIDALAGDMLNRIFTTTDIKTENQIPKNTLCFADALQIEQVMKSLLENALAHTEKGGTVTVNSQLVDGCHRIFVHNTGSHIENELMPQIWQSFYRGDKSHKREESRFGLGLSIVTAIMKLHGTKCGVFNTKNGVCFWFDVNAASASLS